MLKWIRVGRISQPYQQNHFFKRGAKIYPTTLLQYNWSLFFLYHYFFVCLRKIHWQVWLNRYMMWSQPINKTAFYSRAVQSFKKAQFKFSSWRWIQFQCIWEKINFTLFIFFNYCSTLRSTILNRVKFKESGVPTGKCADLDLKEWRYLDVRKWFYLDTPLTKKLNKLDPFITGS